MIFFNYLNSKITKLHLLGVFKILLEIFFIPKSTNNNNFDFSNFLRFR